MRSKLVGRSLAALCAFLLLALGVGLSGCSWPWESSSNAGDSAAVANQAVYQLQAALGLADGAVSQSSQPPLLAGSGVALRWVGGRADVDVDTGRIRAILIDNPEDREPPGETKGTAWSETDLAKEAERVLGLLGWDGAALETHGFTAGNAKILSYPQVGPIYEKTWKGHDPEGVLNQGVLQVGLNVADGTLHSFLCVPGPETTLSMAGTVTKDEAIKTAQAAAAKATFLTISTITTTVPPATTTTTAAKSKTKRTTTTTTAPPTPTTTTKPAAPAATLVHTDDAGITGGKDLLVWVVKLPPDVTAGRDAAVVYVDAAANKPLLVVAA